MMRTSRSILLGIALTAFAASADVVSARKAFNREQSQVFLRSSACHLEFAPKASRPDMPEGRGTYRLVMPYANDARAQFVTAEFADGKFAKGWLHVFGREPVALDAPAFAGMRATRSMFAVKADTGDFHPAACFLPSSAVKLVRGCEPHPVVLSVRANVLGVLETVASNCGIDLRTLRYRVELREPKGLSVDLGVIHTQEAISEETVYEKVRAALEAREPARKGQISDRDIVDFRARCELVFTPTDK